MFEKTLADKQYKLAKLCSKLDSLSPLAVLARGYSITQNTAGNAIIDSAQLQLNEQIQTRFRQGTVISRVIEILD